MPELTVFRTSHFFGRLLLFIRIVLLPRSRRTQRNNKNLNLRALVQHMLAEVRTNPQYSGLASVWKPQFAYKYLYATNTDK